MWHCFFIAKHTLKGRHYVRLTKWYCITAKAMSYGKQSPWTSVVLPYPLLWRPNGHDGISNHQPHDCLPNRLFRRRSKKTSKLRVTGLCAGNSPETGEFPAQMASNAENVFIWWRHHADCRLGKVVVIFKSVLSKHMSLSLKVLLVKRLSDDFYRIPLMIFWVNIGSSDGMVPSGNRPLPQPILNQRERD